MSGIHQAMMAGGGLEITGLMTVGRLGDPGSYIYGFGGVGGFGAWTEVFNAIGVAVGDIQYHQDINTTIFATSSYEDISGGQPITVGVGGVFAALTKNGSNQYTATGDVLSLASRNGSVGLFVTVDVP